MILYRDRNDVHLDLVAVERTCVMNDENFTQSGLMRWIIVIRKKCHLGTERVGRGCRLINVDIHYVSLLIWIRPLK